jgi:hypothetical protein
MRKRIAAAAAGIAVLWVPVVAVAQPIEGDPKQGLYTATERDATNERTPYEERYLEVRERYVDEFGQRAAGRNIVRDGFRERGGDVREPTRQEVVRSTERMVGALKPPAPAVEAEAADVPAAEAPAVESSGGALSATAQCESGGDYSAVDPSGTYHGAYQFDQETWDAYAPEGYAGTNPASAPPAVQDAAAASVDYNAWPNCPSP